MQLQNCGRCGTLFVKQRNEYCDDCTVWFIEHYAVIRDYLRKNPKRTLWDVHTDLAMPLSDVQQVLRYVDEQEKR